MLRLPRKLERKLVALAREKNVNPNKLLETIAQRAIMDANAAALGDMVAETKFTEVFAPTRDSLT